LHQVHNCALLEALLKKIITTNKKNKIMKELLELLNKKLVEYHNKQLESLGTRNDHYYIFMGKANAIGEVIDVIENKTKVLSKADIMRDFNSSDIGKIFWRVEYKGVLTQCLIHEVKKNNEAVVRLATLTDLINEEYNLRSELEYWSSSTYGTDTLRKSNEFYYDFEEAKKISLERFNKEVNPNGKYKVARYFDDVFECYMPNEYPKKVAQIKCNELNLKSKAYISYRIKAIN
jgi:hypothetical protein